MEILEKNAVVTRMIFLPDGATACVDLPAECWIYADRNLKHAMPVMIETSWAEAHLSGEFTAGVLGMFLKNHVVEHMRVHYPWLRSCANDNIYLPSRGNVFAPLLLRAKLCKNFFKIFKTGLSQTLMTLNVRPGYSCGSSGRLMPTLEKIWRLTIPAE